MNSVLFLTCVGVLCGLVQAATVPDNDQEHADRSIILPGSTHYRTSCQWQVETNPCVNNALQALNFPHPSDASKFLQCGLYERMYVVQCPNGELYDQATSSCITPKAIVAQPTYIASLGIPSPCTAQSLQAGRIFFSVANSNKQFIQCDAAGNARVITCPDQLIWDQNRQSCVYTLQGGVANPGYLAAVTGFLNGANPCTAQAISAQALFFSHPDPTKFIQCDLQGNAFVQRCPSGLVWNQYLETCASQLASITLTGQTNFSGWMRSHRHL
ncbi:uncharacterized protein LOC128217414 [Mya arenaria]|uniref:uncharacterized protein LOC128217414 n=1 Tax=Mya arenaria TaxID=6604 RepID=UPI0022DEDB21|nr:uncharacterized protein LOC128217414 [Mya arenaria]